MKFKELEYSRTFNIGNYESEKVTLKADIEDVETQDEFDNSFKTLKAQVFRLQSLKEKEEPANHN